LSLLIGETWDKLFYETVTFVPGVDAGEADKKVTFGQGVEGTEADKVVTFVPGLNESFDYSIEPLMRKQLIKGSSYVGNECHIKIKEANITYPKTVRKSVRLNTPANCITCGKELHPDQRKGSRFCSEKYSGRKEARKCRNEQSNKQKKRKRSYRLTGRTLSNYFGPYSVAPRVSEYTNQFLIINKGLTRTLCGPCVVKFLGPWVLPGALICGYPEPQKNYSDR
jgi:hypothetical protein